jgi:hypothetical protein
MRQLPISGYVINCATDDYKLLPSCLSSLHFCEQKIFVSDKASEKALALAKSYGWDIYHWTGPDSMSERRNFAVGHIGSEWEKYPDMKERHPVIRNPYVMFLDSDEILDPDAYHNIKAALDDGSFRQHARYAFVLRNLRDEGTVISSCPLERMWKTGVFWDRSIQNDVIAEDKTLAMMPCEFFHFGYGNEEKHAFKQWKRISKNEEELTKHPEDMHTRMYLVNALVIAGKYSPLAMDRILAHVDIIFNQFDNSEKTWNEIHALEKTCRFLWNAAMDSGQLHIHISREEKYYEYTKVNPDSAYRLFVSHAEIGELKDAVGYAEKYFSSMKRYREQTSPYAFEITSGEDGPHVKDGLIRCLKKLIETEPENKKWATKKLKYWSNK